MSVNLTFLNILIYRQFTELSNLLFNNTWRKIRYFESKSTVTKIETKIKNKYVLYSL